MTELKVLERRSTGSEKHDYAEKFLKVVSKNPEWGRYGKSRRRDSDVTKVKLSFQEIWALGFTWHPDYSFIMIILYCKHNLAVHAIPAYTSSVKSPSFVLR